MIAPNKNNPQAEAEILKYLPTMIQKAHESLMTDPGTIKLVRDDGRSQLRESKTMFVTEGEYIVKLAVVVTAELKPKTVEIKEVVSG